MGMPVHLPYPKAVSRQLKAFAAMSRMGESPRPTRPVPQAQAETTVESSTRKRAENLDCLRFPGFG